MVGRRCLPLHYLALEYTYCDATKRTRCSDQFTARRRRCEQSTAFAGGGPHRTYRVFHFRDHLQAHRYARPLRKALLVEQRCSLLLSRFVELSAQCKPEIREEIRNTTQLVTSLRSQLGAVVDGMAELRKRQQPDSSSSHGVVSVYVKSNSFQVPVAQMFTKSTCLCI